MAKLTLKQAALWCGGYVDPKYENVEFFGANNDTRIIQPGQLFIVLQGARDGHDFIPMAMEKGAAAALCSRSVGDYPCIIVEDPRTALGIIAREERRRLGAKVVGITGSVGKSTTKEMVASVLGTTYRTGKTPVNHNNDIGMPMAILAMEADTEVMVLEMGMNHFREMAYLSHIAMPDIGVIVNIGTMHIEHLGSRQGIRQAKLELLEGMAADSSLLLNGDDDMLNPLEREISQELTYFGMAESCGVRATEVRQTPGLLTFTVHSGDIAFPVEMALEGMHFVPDAMAAVAVGLRLGVAPEDIARGLWNFRNMAGRQEVYEKCGFTIINDCYNAGPESMAASLAVLGAKPGRKIAVLGDMLELGDCAPAEHRKLGVTAAKNADLIFAYGPHSHYVVEGAGEKARCFDTHAAAAEALSAAAQPGDTILFKGSRGMRMELILERFLKERE